MKKIIRKALCVITALSILCGIRTISFAKVEFDTPYTSLLEKETIIYDEEGEAVLGVGSSAEDLSEFRSTSKNLIVKLFKIETDEATGGRWYTLRLYSKKIGTYKVKYIYTNSNGKRLTKTLKINVTKEKPMKSVKLRGKELEDDRANYVTGKKGKLVVKANKGYKIKKIELWKFENDPSDNSHPKWVCSKVRNNSKIIIPNVPDGSNLIGSDTYIISKYIAARSKLVITYRDKFSKRDKTISYALYKN